MHGIGTYTTHSSGTKYVGEFQNGKSNGWGTQTWPDGTKYVGEWKDDLRNGQGVMIRPDGTKFREGRWIRDKYVRE